MIGAFPDGFQPDPRLFELRQAPIQRLHAFRDLEEGWNGDDHCRRPTDQVIQEALTFLLCALPVTIANPDPLPSGENEVGLYWTSPDRSFFVDVGFYGEGAYSFYAYDAQGQYKGDDIPLETLHPDLAAILARHALRLA
ncbi:MAG: hypothetical protein HQL51_04815 [Magnetococcales bacterium]|nr:hypothetical protein [Magnetococcales bacterium]